MRFIGSNPSLTKDKILQKHTEKQDRMPRTRPQSRGFFVCFESEADFHTQVPEKNSKFGKTLKYGQDYDFQDD